MDHGFTPSCLYCASSACTSARARVDTKGVGSMVMSSAKALVVAAAAKTAIRAKLRFMRVPLSVEIHLGSRCLKVRHDAPRSRQGTVAVRSRFHEQAAGGKKTPRRGRRGATLEKTSLNGNQKVCRMPASKPVECSLAAVTAPSSAVDEPPLLVTRATVPYMAVRLEKL